MSDRLPSADLERLCVALGFKKIWYYAGRYFETEAAAEANYKATGECGTVQSLHVERRPPPIDRDDTWARKAMEAATRKAGVAKSLRFEIQPPVTDDYLWSIEVLRDKRSAPVSFANEKTMALAAARALFEAVKAGPLS